MRNLSSQQKLSLEKLKTKIKRKSIQNLAEKNELSIKYTLKSSVEEYVDKIRFQLYLTDALFDAKFERSDEYWWKIHDALDSYRDLANLAFNNMTLSIASDSYHIGRNILKQLMSNPC